MAKVLIRRAIEQGAPAYNAGQVERCMEIYQETSRELLQKHRQELQGSVVTALEEDLQISMALFDAGKNEVNQLAWAFRRAFDEELAAEESAVSSAKMMIAAAIRRGVPLYNSGNASGCAEVYAETARKLLSGAGGPLSSNVQAALQQAVDTPSEPDARAWALRRAFDAASNQVSVDIRSRDKSRAFRPGLLRDFITNQRLEIAAFVLNDTVMGGRSDSEVLTSQGAVFRGSVTKRGGGFASARFQPRDRRDFLAMLRGAEGLVVKLQRCQGAAGWKLQLNGQEKQWQQDFSLRGTQEEEIRILFSSMWPTWRGRVVGSRGLSPADLEDIQGFGVMLSFLSADGSNNRDFQEGPFDLRLLSISTF